MNEKLKNIILRVDPEFHRALKFHVTAQETTLQKYIVELIEKDMGKIYEHGKLEESDITRVIENRFVGATKEKYRRG